MNTNDPTYRLKLMRTVVPTVTALCPSGGTRRRRGEERREQHFLLGQP